MTSSQGEEIYACAITDIEQSGRQRLTVGGRDIVIVRVGEDIYALDSLCFHSGGPLWDGDIEDLGGKYCLNCPWHSKKVCLETGKHYYESVDPHNQEKPPVWTAGDVVQRTHKVTLRDGKVFILLSAQDKELDSDRYNNKEKDD